MLLPLRTAQWLLRNREWLLTAMAMVVVMLVSAAITLRIALHVREVTVPDFTGHTMLEASQSALKTGVGLVIENRFYSTTVPAGRVLSQSPRSDTVVRHGWQVRVTESLGPQQVTIPNVVGETVRDASIDVRKDELDLGTLAHIEAPGDEDLVLAQTPPPNAGVDQPRINLLLSTAPQPASNAIVLPSFSGLTSTGVIRAASELGLIVSAVGDGPVVTSQSPAPGYRVIRGDSIRVTLGGNTPASPTSTTKPTTPTGPISLQVP
ncbi:PASTA domain-containing protein [Granulicella sp. 5B5]|nr:PASTA domain-containing protein [Granulicella sp. 5B5]